MLFLYSIFLCFSIMIEYNVFTYVNAPMCTESWIFQFLTFNNLMNWLTTCNPCQMYILVLAHHCTALTIAMFSRMFLVFCRRTDNGVYISQKALNWQSLLGAIILNVLAAVSLYLGQWRQHFQNSRTCLIWHNMPETHLNMWIKNDVHWKNVNGPYACLVFHGEKTWYM